LYFPALGRQWAHQASHAVVEGQRAGAFAFCPPQWGNQSKGQERNTRPLHDESSNKPTGRDYRQCYLNIVARRGKAVCCCYRTLGRPVQPYWPYCTLRHNLELAYHCAQGKCAMSEEPILETALRVLSCYIGTRNAIPDPGDIALLHEAAEIPGNEAKPDVLCCLHHSA
jgi:hypothetical protein